MFRHRVVYVSLYILFLLTLLALHYRAFDAPLYYDSLNLQQNEHVFAAGRPFAVINLFPQRPVAMASFYVNYLVSGLTPAHFRMVNALIMAGTALMVVLVIFALLEISEAPDVGQITQNRLIAIALGLFFVVHPVQTFLVLYIWQRMALLSAFFYCAAFLAYLAARSGRFAPKWAGYLISLVMFAAAMTSKENAVTFPVVVILSEIAFFKVRLKTALKLAALLGAGLALFIAAFTFLEHPHGEIAKDSGILATIAQYYAEGGNTPAQIIINQCRMVFHYLSIILLPFPSTVQFMNSQIIHRSLLESPAAIAGVLGAAAFTGLGLYLLRKRPLAGFGILFFLINLLPEGLLVPQYIFISYRAMFPMIGILLVAADCLRLVLAAVAGTRAKASLRIVLAMTLPICLALTAWSTVIKAKSWQDPTALWGDVVKHLPDDYLNSEKSSLMQSLNSLGVSLSRAGRPGEAVSYHLRALEAVPKSPDTYVALAGAYSAQGNMVQAEATYRKALEAKPGSDEAHAGLANLLIRDNRLEDAKIHLDRALGIAPHNPEYNNLMGILYYKQGNDSEALAFFGKALELRPNYVEALFHLGKVFSRLGNLNKAAAQYYKVLEVDPKHWQAHNDMGVILAKTGRPEDAIAHFRDALQAQPENEAVKANMRNALKQAGANLAK